MLWRVVVVALALSVCIEAKLLHVSVLIRHGNRAPNRDVVDLCPSVYPHTDEIIKKFGVTAQGVTRVGLRQCVNLGKMLHHVYITEKEFVPRSFGPHSDLWWFQARGQPRHQQTLAAVGIGLFPPGTGPDSVPERIQPIPINSYRKNGDNVLHPPRDCKALMEKTGERWTETMGKKFMEKNAETVKLAGKACGIDISKTHTPAVTLKEIADSLENGMMEGLPNPKELSSEENWSIIQLAFEMFLSRLFGTEEQITYWAGDFPKTLLGNIAVKTGEKKDEDFENVRMSLYVASRELLYAISGVFGFLYDVKTIPVCDGAMPPTTALLFELHEKDDSPKDYYVNLYIMTPGTSDEIDFDDSGTKLRFPVTMGGCPFDCPLADFRKMIEKRNNATGTWRDICSEDVTEEAVKDVGKHVGRMSEAIEARKSERARAQEVANFKRDHRENEQERAKIKLEDKKEKADEKERKKERKEEEKLAKKAKKGKHALELATNGEEEDGTSWLVPAVMLLSAGGMVAMVAHRRAVQTRAEYVAL